MAKETPIFGVWQRQPAEAPKPFPLPEPLQRMLTRGRAELSAPFRGITSAGTVQSGLFPLTKTGPSLESVVFDHQAGIALDNDEPPRNHIYALVRTPNGNDYGKDLLRQHYARFDHSRQNTPYRRGNI